MSYLELAKQARIRASAGPGKVAAALRQGGRWTVEELARVTGLGTVEVRRELAQLLDLRLAVTAVDFHRRAEVFWESRQP